MASMVAGNIVYPCQQNWSNNQPNRITINALHDKNNRQWNKNFKLNPSIAFLLSCIFLLTLFFVLYYHTDECESEVPGQSI